MATSRWGKLQTAVLYALIDKTEATLREIARYRWDAEPTKHQLRSLAGSA